AFLPADDDLDAGIVQAVEHREVALARYAENPRHTLRLQAVHEHLTAMPNGRHNCSPIMYDDQTSVCSARAGGGRQCVSASGRKKSVRSIAWQAFLSRQPGHQQ